MIREHISAMTMPGINGRLTLDSKLAKWLDMSNSVMYSRQ